MFKAEECTSGRKQRICIRKREFHLSCSLPDGNPFALNMENLNVLRPSTQSVNLQPKIISCQMENAKCNVFAFILN